MTRIGLAVASVGLATALTACGGGSDGEDDFAGKSAEDIVAAGDKAMADVTSIKVEGAVSMEGQEIEINVQTNDQGDCVGSIGVDGGTAELVGVDGSTWFRPNAEFWEASSGEMASQLIEIVGDKWVVVPSDEDGFGQFCNIDDLMAELLDEDDDDEATYTKGDTVDINGEDAIAIDRSHTEDGESTGYILVNDPHYLVKIEKTDGESSGTVTFSEFDEDFEAEAPAEEDTIDLDNLGG